MLNIGDLFCTVNLLSQLPRRDNDQAVGAFALLKSKKYH